MKISLLAAFLFVLSLFTHIRGLEHWFFANDEFVIDKRSKIHNETVARALRSTTRDVASSFLNTAVIVPIQLPSPGSRQEQLSLIILQHNFTQSISNKIIECGAQATATKKKDWGLLNSTRFTPTSLQAEYFANVPDEKSNDFGMNFHNFLDSGDLAKCVGLPSDKILEGRPSGESSGFSRTESTVTPWVIAPVIGCVALITLIALSITLAKNARRVYKVEEYQEDIEESTAQDNTEEGNLEASNSSPDQTGPDIESTEQHNAEDDKPEVSNSSPSQTEDRSEQ